MTPPNPARPRKIGLLLLILLNVSLAAAVLWASRHVQRPGVPPSAPTQPPSAQVQPPSAQLRPPPAKPRLPTRAAPDRFGSASPQVINSCRNKYFDAQRKLLSYLSSKSPADLKAACEGFRSLDGQPMNRYVRYAQRFQAWCQEQQGNTELRDRLRREGEFSEFHYEYFFSHNDLPGFIHYQMEVTCQRNRDDLRLALAAYTERNGGRYPASVHDFVPRDCDVVASCPFTGEDSYGFASPATDAGAMDPIQCRAVHARDVLQASGQPLDAMARTAELEHRYKVHTMLLDGYTEQSRIDRQWSDMARLAELVPGKTVADIGCGPGLFTLPMARAVGPSGKVVAVDINRGVLEFVRFMAAKEPGLQVQTVLTSKNALGLPPQSLDVALIIECYHANLNIRDPREEQNLTQHLLPWLRTVREALKPGGLLLIEDGNVKPEVLAEQLPMAGFEVVPIPADQLSAANRESFNLFRRPR